ncbi:serine/threonine-protein kinase [Zavarzinella formosa]|uniref:serine/threonine-protein kinase n=1 Tax=Zavarzinella formosa TaxID=360055 RepID=UPI0012F79F6F|nr:serine/threonine-protein kinase [Zavarzinella formosa]
MAAPLTPDPSGRSAGPPFFGGGTPVRADGSSARTRLSKTGSSANQPVGPEEPTSPTTPLAESRSDESPTILSSMRPRNAFDAMLTGTFAGRTLGHFEMLEIVGSGGMAAVLKARDLDLGRFVALKILPPEMAVDTENVNRFKQEARAAAKLDDDHIARVYHCGEDQGLNFIAFEFVEGENLRQRMEACGGKIPVRDSIRLMYQVAKGLAHASERGVVHRDIKPSNIIVTPDGNAKIVDMGLARSLLDVRASGQLTHSGVTLGTFDYISPEQAIEPRLADVRSDIYSLGCTFYHLLTGHVPVPEGTVARKLDAHKNLIPTDLRQYNPEVPAELANIINRMMAKEPDQRYQHPDVLAGQLRDLARKMDVVLEPTADASRLREPTAAKWLTFGRVMGTLAVVLLAVLVGLNINERMSRKKDPVIVEGVVSNPTTHGVEPLDKSKDHKDPEPPKKEPEKKDLPPSGPREANNLGDLLSLLKLGAKHIRLTGSDYDLARYLDKDNQPVEALFNGEDLRIEGVGQPTVRLGFTPPGKTRPKAMTLKGPGDGRGSLTIRGVRFQFPSAEGDSENAGLLISQFGRVTVEACTFTSSFKGGRDGRDGPAELAVDSVGCNLTLTQCYFAPGYVGVRLDAPTHLSATECAFAPHHAAIRVMKDDDTSDSELVFKQCSALLTSGTLVEIGDNVGCAVQAGHCIFGGMDRYGPFSPVSTVIRQRGSRASGTRFESAKQDEDGPVMPNVYHNVVPYEEGEVYYTFADCARERIPVRDSDKQLLKAPWLEKDPLSFLVGSTADAKRAFSPNVKLAALRVPSNPNWEMLGARYLGTVPLYGLPLSPPDSEPRDPTIKIWDPSLPEFSQTPAPQGVYRKLKVALDAMKKGDTLLIRHTGKLEVDPCEFEKAETDITIKPEANHKPILVPAPSTLKRSPAMFKLFGGRLALDGLHIHLLHDRVPALAVLAGGGQFEFRNGLLTFEEGEDFSAVTLADPRGEMMMMGAVPADRWPIPKIVIENSVIRGHGRVFNVQGSRPFEAEVKNTLVVVDGLFLDIHPSNGDPSGAGSGLVKLHCLTYCGTGPLVHLRATDKKNDVGAAGLTKTEITASNCVILPPADSHDPIILAERIDSKDQLAMWVSWKGKNNIFAMAKGRPVIEMRPVDLAANPPKVIDAEHWADLAGEDTEPLGNVKIDGNLPALSRPGAFVAARPADFRIKSISPKMPDRPADTGAQAEGLPKQYQEE